MQAQTAASPAQELPRASSFARWSVLALIIIAIASYYRWELLSAGHQLDWVNDQPGYYNHLGRAFANAQLALPIQPSPELLALPDPWDPAVDDSYKMHDLALFNGRYYLYHGPGPAILLFTPWRLITGHDLPERFALFLLCFGGFVFSCGVLLRWLALAGAGIDLPLLALMLLALGLCQAVPYLLSRVWVYEIAIAGGYFCISAAMFALAMAIHSSRIAYWLGASGFLFGLAISCRPHLGLAGIIAFAGLAIYCTKTRSLGAALLSKELIAFASAFLLVATAVAAYNYQRFGNPFEFGIRYILAGANQNRIRLSLQNIFPGFYFWLACPPGLSPVFPWISLVSRYPFHSATFPPEYFLESTTGVFYLAPCIIGAFLTPFRRDRILLWMALTSSAAVLLFLAATGFTTQRYEVDFLPPLVLVALANFGIYISRCAGIKRALISTALVLSIACGAVVNMALGISGPYGEMLRNRPGSYLRIAGWFSPLEQFRPLLNPAVSVSFTAKFNSPADGLREPLLTLGHQPYVYFLYAEHSDGKLLLVSRYENAITTHELENPDSAQEFRVSYNPDSGKVTTAVNGQEILTHSIGTLVTARSEIAIGENQVDPLATAAHFSGRIENPVKTLIRSPTDHNP